MNPFSNFKTHDYILLIISVVSVTISNMMTPDISLVTLFATSIGVTALVFLAKGNVWGQILSVIFSILYAIISYDMKYYGEMITYLFMTMPMAAMSTVSWLKNPSEVDKDTVAIHKLNIKEKVNMIIFAIITTWVFYYILKYFHTSSLIVSTISITTSFLASYLTYYRNSYYALCYAVNDIVLIILWIIASVKDFRFFPMIICFVIFFINDIYGFISWKRRERKFPT